MKQKAIAIASFVLAIALWEGLVYFRVVPDWIIPSPAQVVDYLYRGSGDMLVSVGITLRRLLIGYFLGVLIGHPLGILTARFRFCQHTIGTVALGLQTLPSVCWVPLALLWFGLTENAMLFVVVMGSLWSVLLSTVNGVQTVPPIYVRAARTMGSRNLHTWTQVILPAALPFIVSGMKQGWAFAWRSLMAAEIAVPTMHMMGLGRLLEYGRDDGNMSQVVGVMVVIILIGLLTDKLLFSPWERFLHRRWGLVRP